MTWKAKLHVLHVIYSWDINPILGIIQDTRKNSENRLTSPDLMNIDLPMKIGEYYRRATFHWTTKASRYYDNNNYKLSFKRILTLFKNPILFTEDLRNSLHHHAEVDLPNDDERRDTRKKKTDTWPCTMLTDIQEWHQVLRTQGCSRPAH